MPEIDENHPYVQFLKKQIKDLDTELEKTKQDREMANEFVVMEQRCEMCKTVAPCADCDMVVAGTIIARFPLCIGCQKEMKETYKDSLKSTAEKAKDSK